MGPISTTMWAQRIKLWFDVVAGILLLLVVSPVLLVSVVIMLVTDPGPVFFRQLRVGKNGVVFPLLKLRSMKAGRKPDPNEIVPLSHPEITPFGRLIRRCKIDELPQLFNVIRGDMSLIGPRPTLPEQVAGYDEFRLQRLLVRPGMTGLAQIFGNTALTWDERMLFDIAYVRRCSAALDLWIIWQTVWVVVRGDEAKVTRFTDSTWRDYVPIPQDFETGKA